MVEGAVGLPGWAARHLPTSPGFLTPWVFVLALSFVCFGVGRSAFTSPSFTASRCRECLGAGGLTFSASALKRELLMEVQAACQAGVAAWVFQTEQQQQQQQQLQQHPLLLMNQHSVSMPLAPVDPASLAVQMVYRLLLMTKWLSWMQ